MPDATVRSPMCILDPMNATVTLTAFQAEFLTDLSYASENMALALDQGAIMDGLTLTIPPVAANAICTAIGIRADMADEGCYSLGERSSILSLARKVATATNNGKALPLPS